MRVLKPSTGSDVAMVGFSIAKIMRVLKPQMNYIIFEETFIAIFYLYINFSIK